MTKITENTIEEFIITLLEHNGYEYIYAHAAKKMNVEIKICDK